MHEWALASPRKATTFSPAAPYGLIAQSLYANVIAQYDVFRKAREEE